ncbi:hypothetical protein ZYGR_0AI05740 [Zygosaccharomyces rouxii]|uniref:Trafficking protein particle complex II-specific subunit 65 n=1 Tax=Zygosaccharomyces rouxii TaxID=4956 RepID=A0A1Q3ACE1_ZYGRO|nr:hypothetical protein ZYGR_0AI05740 [Zygosaccharomyces rouxii]
MECCIPLIPLNESFLFEKVKHSHELRRFVIFDEELTIHLSTVCAQTQIRNFIVWINDAKVLQLQGLAAFQKVADQDERTRWILKSGIRDSLFRSSVVMNNGYNNQIKFTVEYKEDETEESSNESTPMNNGEDADADDDFIPSFETVSPQGSESSTPVLGSPVRSRTVTNYEDDGLKSVSLKFPIYSLLNMRLRNSLLKNRHCIISSLDFQTSKASLQFTEQYLQHKNDQEGQAPSVNDNELNLEFHRVSYELVDRNSRCPLKPLRPFPVPFQCVAHDSYNVSYQLPLVPEGGNSPHRVKITLKYELLLSEGKVPISTTWETDVTLKRPLTSTPNPTSTSLPAASRMYSLGSRMNLAGSTTSFTNNKLNNVKFKFLDTNISTYRGEQFTMTLQIVNSSLQPLDLVIYYNNKNPPPLQSAPTPVSLERQYQMYKRYNRTMEGVILLSNDYKVPIIGPQETYFVQLNFVGIMSGYYSTLPGLKIVDLQKNELIEVGLGASILIK